MVAEDFRIRLRATFWQNFDSQFFLWLQKIFAFAFAQFFLWLQKIFEFAFAQFFGKILIRNFFMVAKDFRIRLRAIFFMVAEDFDSQFFYGCRRFSHSPSRNLCQRAIVASFEFFMSNQCCFVSASQPSLSPNEVQPKTTRRLQTDPIIP